MHKPGNTATEQNVTVTTMTGGEVEVYIGDDQDGKTYVLTDEEAKALMIALIRTL